MSKPLVMCGAHLVVDCIRCGLGSCQRCVLLEAEIETWKERFRAELAAHRVALAEIEKLRAQLPPTREDMESWVKPEDRKKPGKRS